MKNLLLALLLFPLIAHSQVTFIGGKNSTIEVLGALKPDSAFQVPFIDTSKAPYTKGIAGYGQIGIGRADSLPYIYYRGEWTRIATGSSSGGGLTIGDAVSGGNANSVLFEDASQNLASAATFTYNAGGTGRLKFTKTTLIPSLNEHTVAFPDRDITVAGVDELVFHTQVSISSAQLLAINSTPVQLVPPPGAGKYIIPHKIAIKLNFVTTQYTTNTALNIYENASALMYPAINGPLASTADGVYLLERSGTNAGAFTPVLIDNGALMMSSNGGNPTDGGGNIIVYIEYTIWTP